MRDTKTIQTLASVSLIGGPLSIIVGGVLLSIAALVCGIVALVLVRKQMQRSEATATDAIMQALTRQAVIGIAVSGIALVGNAAAMAMMLPDILNAAQTGDFSSLLGGGSSGAESSGTTDSGDAFGGSTGDKAPEAPQNGRSSVWG